MEQNNNKIMTIVFVAAGFLAGVIVRVIMDTLQAVSSVVVQMNSIEAVKHGIPLAVGLLVFALLQFNPKVRVWADECIIEVKKVVWPSKKDTIAMTTVVCVMLVIAGVVLGVFDVVAGNIIKLLIN